jgi:hypothetical protein
VRNFVAQGIETVIADMIRRRAMSRARYFTDEEFENLHLEDVRRPPPADHHLDVSDYDLSEQVAAIAALWKQDLGS